MAQGRSDHWKHTCCILNNLPKNMNLEINTYFLQIFSFNFFTNCARLVNNENGYL